MSSSSNGPSFLTSHGKKYHPSFEWNDEEGLLQDPKTHAPHSHIDLKVSFSLVSLFGKMLFTCFIESLMVRHCHFFVWSCWNLRHCMIDHVVILALEHFWSVVFFSHCVIWTMLVAHWILAMLVICDVVGWILALDFVGIDIVKNLCCRLVWKYSWRMWEILLVCVNFISWNMAKFQWDIDFFFFFFFCGTFIFGRMFFLSWEIFAGMEILV